MAIALMFGFLLGVVVILVVEGLFVLFLIRKLSRKNRIYEKALEKGGRGEFGDLDVQQSLDYAFRKQGNVWVLEPEKLAKATLDKGAKEQKKKKEVFEVSPVRKYAKIVDRVLNLSGDSSDSCIKILLKGCTVEAVSATSMPSKKWAKRYPIKIESRTSTLYKGSKIFYIYLDTNWEKESWCKALRAASCEDTEHLNSLALLSKEFRSYLSTLNSGYPSLLKPSAESYADIVEKDNRLDDSSSKVRVFLKRLAKKASKNYDSKVSSGSTSSREDKRFGLRSQSFQESVSASSVPKVTPPSKTHNNLATEKMAWRSTSFSAHSDQNHVTTNSDAEADEKVSVDEGTLCWNLLLSRLFFDAKRNADICTFIQARIQRTLCNLRIPSYIGEVSCTGVKPGDLPPCILAMRALPTDLNEICALEIDVIYSGGFLLEIATRLEVRELEVQKESNSVKEISSGLLEEYLGEQLKLSEGIADVAAEAKDEDDSINDASKITKGGAVPKWKSIINTVAKQVSQVPISLAIRIASLQGTLQLRIKPPPSDQLWFGFTSMPEIEFDLASSVGDHKITNGHLALFLINRFKTVVRETLVLPNCESICIPWMSAEKNDWVPRELAPFIWLNQDTNSSSSMPDARSSHSGDHKTPKHDSVKESVGKFEEDAPQNQKPESGQGTNCEISDVLTVHHTAPKPPSGSYQSLKELKTPLLKKDNNPSQNIQQKETMGGPATSSRSILPTIEDRNVPIEDDDSKTKKWGRRSKMLDLGKKMSEKIEGKRRELEEKSRSIVEKMRAPGNS